jgi:VWFA-related protein
MAVYLLQRFLMFGFFITALLMLFPQNAQIRERVDLVVVPATVQDSQGKLVTGLTEDNFEILEGGVRQRISNFSIDPQSLSAAIVVDDGMNGNQLRRLYPRFSPSVLNTLGSNFSGNDLMAAFRYDRLVYKLSDFTDDPAAIEKSFAVIKTFGETRPDETADLLGEHGPRALRSILNVLNFGHPSERPTRGALHDAIYEAATALLAQPADRRKIVLIISDGRVAGPNEHTFEKTVDMLVQNQIQVYGVSAQYATFGSFGALTSYARATGGDVFPGTSTKSMEAAFSRITEQARNQYVLGYVSNNRAERGPVFRNIQVKTHPRGYTVQHRKGYLQNPAE